jgi:hypothetical protein
MVFNKRFATTTLAALVAFGALASNKALAQDPESVSFTVKQAVTVSGHELAAGRYTVRPSSNNGTLMITRAEDQRFVTFVLPTSKDLGKGETPAVKLVNYNGATAVESVYFPDNGRAYYFNTTIAAR